MNIKSAIAAFATVTATIALSANAFAGELYGGLEGNIDETRSSVLSVVQLPSNSFGEGELYTAANDALDIVKGSAAPRQPYVTTLAVGGELGFPIGGAYGQSGATDSSFAE